MRSIDELLQAALSPTEEMSDELKTRIMTSVVKRKEQKMDNVTKIRKRYRVIPTAAAAAVALLLTSVTAFAAWRYLSANEVAQKVDDGKLAEAFAEVGAWENGEVQTCGGYDISLLGLASGREISDYLVTQNGELVSDNTYAVVAISKEDGTPMPDTMSEEYSEHSFLVSPYIEGYNPALYNVFTLEAGGYEETVEQGVLYRIMHVEDIEALADHTIYLGVTDGTFYNDEAYIYEKTTGKIDRNPAYTGVNALFTLPIDASKADAVRADEIIHRIDHPEGNE